PVQPHLPKGSLIIRDLRLWHNGKRDGGNEGPPRVMLILIEVFFASWYRSSLRLTLF
ncbi:hypothetical protein PUNSTDRAFT_65708, partial [Punctularia strigosozonata HHB-11173 SS5]|uniref:uncharacterized protein n=1 Tax=Punctularia strigosozonata (strain HHB-11173) TaxID=741275 RepID=UPI0004418668